MEAPGRRAETARKRGSGKKSAISNVQTVHAEIPDPHSRELNSTKSTTDEGLKHHGKTGCTTLTLDRQGIVNAVRASCPEIGGNAELSQENYCSSGYEPGQLEANEGYVELTAPANDGNRPPIPVSVANSVLGNDDTVSMNSWKGGGFMGETACLDAPLTEGGLNSVGVEVLSKGNSDLHRVNSSVYGYRNKMPNGGRFAQREVSRGRSRGPDMRKIGDNGRNGGWNAKGVRNAVQPGRTFASLLNANPMGKKMKMDYVEPVMDGEQPIFMPKEEVIEQAKKKWENYIVGYFISGSLAIASVERVARGYWSKLGLGRVLADTSGFYFFEVPDANERLRILEEGPWLFYGRGMVLQQWSPELVLCKKAHDKIPLWVRFHKVPLTLWTAAGLSGVASLVGKPLYADSYTENMEKIDFARICVEVESNKPLPDTVLVHMAGEVIHIPVDYQWKPARCSKCEVFGHVCRIEHEEKQQEEVAHPVETRRMQATPMQDNTEKDGFTLVQNRRNNRGVGSEGCQSIHEEQHRIMTKAKVVHGRRDKEGRMKQQHQKVRLETTATSLASSSSASPYSSEGSDTEEEPYEEAISRTPVVVGRQMSNEGNGREKGEDDGNLEEDESWGPGEAKGEMALSQVVAAIPNDQFQRKPTSSTPPKKTKKSAGKSKASKPRRR